jgi:hypothetical protein
LKSKITKQTVLNALQITGNIFLAASLGIANFNLLLMSTWQQAIDFSKEINSSTPRSKHTNLRSVSAIND